MLAAVASAAIYLCECYFEWQTARLIADPIERAKVLDELLKHVFGGGLYCVAVVTGLLCLMLLHEKYENARVPRGARFWHRRNVLLLGVSNVAGLGMLGGMVYVVRS